MAKMRGGYVPNDGNGMVGGSWFSRTDLCDKFVAIEDLTEDEAVAAWLSQRMGDEAIIVEAHITSGYDHSVGIDCFAEVDDFIEPEGFEDAVAECPLLTEETRKALWEKFETIAYDTANYETKED